MLFPLASVHSRPGRRRPWRFRRLLLHAVGLLLVLSGVAPAAAAPKFDRDTVVEKARALSRTPFVAPHGEVPKKFLDLSYDEWRDIRFRPEKALWREENLPFQLQFFHPGLFYDRLVRINIVDRSVSAPLPFDPSAFDYGSNHGLADRVPSQFGFAGFRIHGPINTPSYFDEIAVFLGATYFRAVAKGQVYGLSARGLAIDTALPDGEEFPYFREFWIEKPGRHARRLTVHALLDSESVTGAYTFVISGGVSTEMDVTATLFLRKPVQRLGLGPLTSMFLFGENTSPRPLDDFRPEVHDSDGLLIHEATGEWFWRPLTNPSTLQVDAFRADDVLGFGLIQRDHDFVSYQDLEARYERRPSLWIKPGSKWGPGHVLLVRIPSDREIHDNIVAFWTPEKPLEPGGPYTYKYAMRWYAGQFTHPPLGYVTATRTGGSPGGGRRFVIDFDSKALRLLGPKAKVNPVITCGEGASVVERHMEKNPHTGGWRLSFAVRPDKEPSALEKMLPAHPHPVDLRVFLTINDVTLTETWNYAYLP